MTQFLFRYPFLLIKFLAKPANGTSIKFYTICIGVLPNSIPKGINPKCGRFKMSAHFSYCINNNRVKAIPLIKTCRCFETTALVITFVCRQRIELLPKQKLLSITSLKIDSKIVTLWQSPATITKTNWKIIEQAVNKTKHSFSNFERGQRMTAVIQM